MDIQNKEIIVQCIGMPHEDVQSLVFQECIDLGFILLTTKNVLHFRGPYNFLNNE